MKRSDFYILGFAGLLGFSQVCAISADSIKAGTKNISINNAPHIKVEKMEAVSEAHSIVMQKTDASESPKIANPIGEVSISQSFIRIYLQKPANITLYNARGQIIYHMESQRQIEILPLQGLQPGFIYLSLRVGKEEFTKKLVYTGK